MADADSKIAEAQDKDDVEGHKYTPLKPEDEDVEGHKFTPKKPDEGEDDVEGHKFIS